MANVKISAVAEADLRQIWSYIAESNSLVADKFIKDLLQKIRRLGQNPEMGRDRSEIIINLRSFPVKKYVIFYMIAGEDIEIYRVLHGSRSISEFFDDYIDGLKE